MIFKDQTKVLLDLRNKVNTISQAFTYSLGLKIQKTSIGVQKINGTTLGTYKMAISIFSILDKDSRERFFKKSFLLANVQPDVLLGIFYLAMSNADIDY